MDKKTFSVGDIVLVNHRSATRGYSSQERFNSYGKNFLVKLVATGCSEPRWWDVQPLNREDNRLVQLLENYFVNEKSFIEIIDLSGLVEELFNG